MAALSKKSYLVIAIMIIALIVGYLIFSNKNSKQTSNSNNNKTNTSSVVSSEVSESNQTQRFYSKSNDKNYIYQFDNSTHKLSRLNRSDLKTTGVPADFFYIENVGATDANGNTFIVGAKSNNAVSQNFLCNFSTDCRPVDINISQVLLTPNRKTMVVKYQNEQYQFGYFDASTETLTPVIALASPYYEINFVDSDNAILFETSSSSDPGAISIVNLASKKITKQIDEAIYFASSPDANVIIYGKKEGNDLVTYAYNTITEKKARLSGNNFHSFFFDQSDNLYEISAVSSKIINHDISSGSDKTKDTKDIKIESTNLITEILWLNGSTYLITFTDGKTQQIEL